MPGALKQMELCGHRSGEGGRHAGKVWGHVGRWRWGEFWGSVLVWERWRAIRGWGWGVLDQPEAVRQLCGCMYSMVLGRRWAAPGKAVHTSLAWGAAPVPPAAAC